MKPEVRQSAGLVIIYDGKILLARTAGRPDTKSWGIPKGGIEAGEDLIEAAIRETYEELGLKVPRRLIGKTEYTITINASKWGYFKELHYYIVQLDSLSQLGLKSLQVPKSQLDLKEISEARFMNLTEALAAVMISQQSIIQGLSSILETKQPAVKILSLHDFLLEKKNNEANDLYCAYLAIDPASGHRWWSYKDFAGDNFFIQITLENYKVLDINPDFPVLNYNTQVTQTLLDKKLIKLENVYNVPEFIKMSGSKTEFHKIVDGDENIPTTAYTPQDAVKSVGFPMIAKPAHGHSGLGIQVFKTQADFDKADLTKLDVFCQYVDKRTEHRIITFAGSPMYWMERVPMNDKAKSGDGKGEEQMVFKYILRDVTKLPENYQQLMTKYCKMFDKLPYITFDVMESKTGKLYIIESNSQPGVPFDSTVQLYRNLFKDFYKRDVDSQTDLKLKQLSDFMCKKTLELDPTRFEIGK